MMFDSPVSFDEHMTSEKNKAKKTSPTFPFFIRSAFEKDELTFSFVGDDLFQDNTDTFDQNVARMELQFTALLTDLLHKISELGHANYDSHMLTLTNR